MDLPGTGTRIVQKRVTCQRCRAEVYQVLAVRADDRDGQGPVKIGSYTADSIHQDEAGKVTVVHHKCGRPAVFLFKEIDA